MKVDLPYFGEIHVELTDEVTNLDWNVEVELLNQAVNLDLEVMSEDIDVSFLKDFLSNLPTKVQLAQKALENDYQNGKEVKFYLQHHLEEFDEEELASLEIDTLNNPIEQLFKQLHLTDISISFDEEWFVNFDFTIDEELTNYLLAVSFDEEGVVSDIAMES